MNKLILLRHGQSKWNLENRFTGWKDVPLTEKGTQEAIDAGKLMYKHNILIDLIFSSTLKRANETAKLAILQMNHKNLLNDNDEIIMFKDQSLNERDYGELVGLNKLETAKKFGKEQVHIWRRSFDIPPPGGESLKDVFQRVKTYFETNIRSKLNQQKNILIVAHGNSLRAMLICIGLYQSVEISKIELPTGCPFVCYYEKDELIKSEYLN
jgi:2,3-bisphosphoglycerate-dependent phosphoglycerate mutase